MILAGQDARELFQNLLFVVGRKTLRGPPWRKQLTRFGCIAGADIGAGKKDHAFGRLWTPVAKGGDYDRRSRIFLEQGSFRIAAQSRHSRPATQICRRSRNFCTRYTVEA